jgi:hypothetical protein
MAAASFCNSAGVYLYGEIEIKSVLRAEDENALRLMRDERGLSRVVPDETSFSPIETSMRLLAFYVLNPSRQGI